VDDIANLGLEPRRVAFEDGAVEGGVAAYHIIKFEIYKGTGDVELTSRSRICHDHQARPRLGGESRKVGFAAVVGLVWFARHMFGQPEESQDANLTASPLICYGSVQPSDSPVTSNVESALGDAIEPAVVWSAEAIPYTIESRHLLKQQGCEVAAWAIRFECGPVCGTQVFGQVGERTSLDEAFAYMIGDILRDSR
jgi:hypothetical protein